MLGLGEAWGVPAGLESHPRPHTEDCAKSSAGGVWPPQHTGHPAGAEQGSLLSLSPPDLGQVSTVISLP